MFAQSGELQWLKEWKQNCGFRIISINNEGWELNDFRIKRFGLHQCFDAFISSCEVGMRKPTQVFSLCQWVSRKLHRRNVVILMTG
jgi:putative hydrolase of the HAD superfamily